MLFTTLPVNTQAQVEKVIEGYQMRWLIEVYFKTLKSGMKIEDMKYQTLKRYLAAFAMLAIVGWRVEFLKMALTATHHVTNTSILSNGWLSLPLRLSKNQISPSLQRQKSLC